jgi:hypothetical protein
MSNHGINMKTLLALAATLLVWSASAQSNITHILAGPFTNLANGHFYYLLKSTTWSNSEARAVQYGGHLATVRDADENQWIVDTFSNFGGQPRPLYIGLTDADSEGTWTWTSGEPVTYTNWNTASGEPNNSGGSGYEEDCVYIVQPFSGNPTLLASYWNDVPNNGAGVSRPCYGVLETTTIIENLPPVGVPPLAHVRLSCVEVCWQSQNNIQYQVQWKPALPTTNWFNLGPVITGNGSELCVTDYPRGTNRVYRVQLVSP